jgi:chromatin structure-remodeling complex protein RSC7
MVGFKDSLYFFRKTPTLVRCFLTQTEKAMLIESGHVDAKLKGRNVAVVAARNVFKLFGKNCVRRECWCAAVTDCR